MSFSDQKTRIATEADCEASWSGEKNGKRFRCYLCGFKFKINDIWRFIIDNDGKGCGGGNFIVCQLCDQGDVREVWRQMNIDFENIKVKYWWYDWELNE